MRPLRNPVLEAATKEDIHQRLRAGVFTLQTTPLGLKKSSVWSVFGIVQDGCGRPMDYVACKRCLHVRKHSGRASGTSTLKRHVCKARTDDMHAYDTLYTAP